MKKFLFLSLLILSIASCEGTCELIEQQYQQMLIEQCQERPTGITGKNVGDKYQKSPKVWWFRFDIPGSSQDNCDLKFLEGIRMAEVPAVELVRWEQHDVGNALYIVHSKTPIGQDSSRFLCRQERETFEGVLNTDGICNGGNVPAQEIFYVRFNQCKYWAEVGDSLGLRVVQ